MTLSKGAGWSASIYCVVWTAVLAMPAFGQTLSTYDPDVSCSFVMQESELGGPYCGREGAARTQILDAAELAREICLTATPADTRLSVLEVAGRHQIAPLSSDDMKGLKTGAKRRQQRAETPVFIDPKSGAIHIDTLAMTDDWSAPNPALEIGLQRNLGLALMGGFPNLAKALSETGMNDRIVAQMEAIASFPSLIAMESSEHLPGINFSRDFTQPLFSSTVGWGNAEFWRRAFDASRAQTQMDAKEYFTGIFIALDLAAREDGATLAQLFQTMDVVFRENFGWSQFEGDGFGRAYAAAMASHQMDEISFLSTSEDLTLKAQSRLVQEIGASQLGPLTSKFLDLDIAGSQLHETELAISVCETSGADCIKTDKVRLLFEGHAIDARADLRSFKSSNGDDVTVIDSNHVQMTLPSRRNAFGADDKAFFGLKFGISNVTPDEVVNYQVKVSLVVREASCEWSAMAATMNPWWRGDLSAPGSITPDLQDMPADMRMEISNGLRDGWILTQSEYWQDIGLDEQVFGDRVSEEELRFRIPSDWDAATIPEMWRQDSPKKEILTRYFARLMPSAARATLSGAVSDSGTICVSPVATSALMDMSALSEGTAEDMLESMGLPPELLQESGEDLDEFAAIASILRNQATGDETIGNQTDAGLMLQIFSPNLFTQQIGLIPSGAMVPLRHSGSGGWRNNAGFNIYVHIPDVAVRDIITGEFPVKGILLPAIGQEPVETSEYPPFYMWGETSGDDIKFEDYIAPTLSGSITILKRVEGAAIASLELSGQTYRRDGKDKTGAEPDVMSVGSTTITINRMFLLGLSEGEPLPVLNMFDLTTARLQ